MIERDGGDPGADASARAWSILKSLVASTRPAMFDRLLDDLPSEKVDPPLEAPATRAGPVGWLRGLWPVGRGSQVIFAEAFRQGLVEGLPADRALALATEITPGRRFRRALTEMAEHLRSGYTLEASLAKTGVRVSPRLRAALRVGQEHGRLAGELAAFTRGDRRAAPRAFHRAIGRSEAAARFAAALARLLRGGRLTVRVVRDAGELAAGGRGFARVMADVARRMEDGATLAEALRRHPGHFDPFSCGLLAAVRSRTEMRACLTRLAGEDAMGPVALSGADVP